MQQAPFDGTGNEAQQWGGLDLGMSHDRNCVLTKWPKKKDEAQTVIDDSYEFEMEDKRKLSIEQDS